MVTKRDYYEILGVGKNATESEIKKAYRSLARKYHPDVYKEQDASSRFKEINEAYQVLSDPKKRSAYDQFGHSAFQAGGPSSAQWEGWGRAPGVEFNFDFGDFRDPFEIFEEFFGTRSPFGFDFGSTQPGKSRGQVGEDLHFELTIPFKEAIFGTERTASFSREIVCPQCSGSGADKGSKRVTCDKCRGQGVVRQARRSIFGSIYTSVTCDKCGGSGTRSEKECPRCKGKTVVRIDQDQKLRIPSGVEDGTIIRYPLLGNAVPKGGEYGDLYLTLRVLTSKEFRREGMNIYYDLDVEMTQAALGDKVSVPTLEGEEKIKLPPGTQPGEEIRLAERGVPYTNGRGRGDLVIKVNVKIPPHLSRKQEELLKEFNKS